MSAFLNPTWTSCSLLPVSDTLALCVYVMPKFYLKLILRHRNP